MFYGDRTERKDHIVCDSIYIESRMDKAQVC